MRTEVIIGVESVVKSSEWYTKVFDCNSRHGGETFEILTDQEDNVILCLHKWGEHDHPTLVGPGNPVGNGIIIYLRVDDLEQVYVNARELNAVIENEPRLNRNSGKTEFAIRDPDGYYLLVSL